MNVDCRLLSSADLNRENYHTEMKTRVIAWWSGGVSSALACWWAIQAFKDVRVIFIDTKNEDEDTYRFFRDCEGLYGQYIEVASKLPSKEYKSIEDVWLRYLSLNVATGAICSAVLKREIREELQSRFEDYAQVFGFDVTERKRHINMRKNYPEINVISPLVDLNMTKSQVMATFKDFGIEVPRVYKFGFKNNNCFKTGCVQGGIGYWQKIQREFPDKFNAMAVREHSLTDQKKEPVTICKDQSEGGGLVFLLPHPDYPAMKDISMMQGREPEALVECNGFCSTKD